MDCKEEREGPAAMEPVSLEFTLIGLGHGSLLESETSWHPSLYRVVGVC